MKNNNGGFIMEFFNGIGKKITQTGQGVVQKTKDTAEIIKLNGAISDEEKKVNNAYFQIGQLYFSKYRDNADEDFSFLVEQVNNSLSQIEDLKQQIQHIKGVKVCNNCGAEIPENSMFCIGCGAKIVMQSEVNTNNFIRCVKCNNLVEKGLKFCTFCGSTLADNTVIKTKCAVCGADLNGEVAFCSECGTKVFSSEEE